MAAHPLRPAATAALRLPRNRFEHLRQGPRVVARAGHDLRAEQVGLLLEIAAVSEEQGAQPEIRTLGDGRSRAPSDHGTAQLPGELPELQPRILRLRRIRRSVAQQDVGQLVGHHASHLAFRGGRA